MLFFMGQKAKMLNFKTDTKHQNEMGRTEDEYLPGTRSHPRRILTDNENGKQGVTETKIPFSLEPVGNSDLIHRHVSGTQTSYDTYPGIPSHLAPWWRSSSSCIFFTPQLMNAENQILF